MSCDSVRRNFASIPEDKALPWAWRENLHLLQDVIAEDYVADLDPTVKPLYGHQEGAEIGYNPQKPGRPSHCYHTLCIAKLRLTLAVVVHPGNETSGTHSRSMLTEYLEFVSSVKKPRLVRGDVSFGNESVVGDCEAAGVRYLFKTKRSKSVRRAFLGLLAEPGAWHDSSEGWQCAEREVRLDSWNRARRMVFARLSRHARQGIVTIYTATSERARETYRAISAFLSRISSASLGPLRPLRGSLRSGDLIASRQANVEP